MCNATITTGTITTARNSTRLSPSSSGRIGGTRRSPRPVVAAACTRMLSAATGGPQKYSGRDMAKAHAGLDITDEAFDRVVGHLNATLVETGADDGTIRAVLGALVPLRPSIVTA